MAAPPQPPANARLVYDFRAPPFRLFETEDPAAPPDAPKAARFAWWLEAPGAPPRPLTFLRAGDGWRWFAEGALVFPAASRSGSFTAGGKTYPLAP